MTSMSEALRRKAKKRAKPAWQMSMHATIINAEECTMVHKRNETEANRKTTGTPIGYIVQIFTGTGEAWGWQGFIFTDHKRRRRGTREVTARTVGNGAKKKTASAVWAAREVETIYPEAGTAATDYGYGCGRDSRTYREPS